MAKQGCNAHVGKAVSLQPRLQLLLGDIQRDEQVEASAEIARGVHVGVEHPRWLEGGDHNAQTSWQCVHLDQLLDRWPESFSKVFLVTVSGVVSSFFWNKLAISPLRGCLGWQSGEAIPP